MRKSVPDPAIAGFAAALAIVAALAFAPAAQAQPAPGDLDNATCARLDQQFNFVARFKDGLPYTEDAREIRAAARAECRTGDTEAGAAQFREALRTLLVEPAA